MQKDRNEIAKCYNKNVAAIRFAFKVYLILFLPHPTPFFILKFPFFIFFFFVAATLYPKWPLCIRRVGQSCQPWFSVKKVEIFKVTTTFTAVILTCSPTPLSLPAHSLL